MAETFQPLTEEQIASHAKNFSISEDHGGTLRLSLNTIPDQEPKRIYFWTNEGLSPEPVLSVFDSKTEVGAEGGKTPTPDDLYVLMTVAQHEAPEHILTKMLVEIGYSALKSIRKEMLGEVDRIGSMMTNLQLQQESAK